MAPTLSPALQVRIVAPVACWPDVAWPKCSSGAPSNPGHAGMGKCGTASRWNSSPWQCMCVMNEWVELLKGPLPAASVTTCHPALSHFAWWWQGGDFVRCVHPNPAFCWMSVGKDQVFPCNIYFSTYKSGTEAQFLSLSFTKSSVYQWHLICHTPSFCWAVKLQNEPLQQKAHLTQTASVHLWVEKCVKSDLYFTVFSSLFKFKIFLNSHKKSFSVLVLIPQSWEIINCGLILCHS